MQFLVLDRFHKWPSEAPVNLAGPLVTLRRNTWNDYGFRTLFNATLHNTGTGPRELGEVKIIRRGQSADDATHTLIPSSFTQLSADFTSLGQSLSFYETLAQIGGQIAKDYLQGMNDAAVKTEVRDSFDNEEAFRVSLLRTSDALEALENAAALFGKAEPDKVDAFEIEAVLGQAEVEHRVSFDFTPFRGLPHRISVLVGLNGVGKTALMARLALLITRFETDKKERKRTAAGETFEDQGKIVPRPSLYTVIAVSFSAFDDFEIPKTKEGDRYRYVYCGLRKITGGIRSIDEISERVRQLVSMMDARQKKYLSSISGHIIPSLAASDFIENPLEEKNFYSSLSAGQRIALNIICELIVNIEKRSLILLDEPENHLHPQLLSTVLAIINDLLKASDSFAIVATHSPIVLQQVPSRAVSVIRRVMGRPVVSRPKIECFGENLTEIVRSVFEAVESDRSYEQVIDELLTAHDSDVEAVEALFDDKIGMNARLYLHSRGQL